MNVGKLMFRLQIRILNEWKMETKLGYLLFSDLFYRTQSYRQYDILEVNFDTLNEASFKTIRILDPPNTPIIEEKPCQTNSDGDCIVFNCPWKKFNTDEAPHMIRAQNENKKCMHLTDAKRLERDLNNDELDLNQECLKISRVKSNSCYM